MFVYIFRASLISPTNQNSIREEDNEIDEEDKNNLSENISTFTPTKTAETPTPVEPPTVPKTDKVESLVKAVNNNKSSTAERSLSTVETPPPIAVSVLNRKFSEAGLNSANKPIVTFTNQDSANAGPPPVRRKSSELSTSMRSRLEAFISPSSSTAVSSGGSTLDSREKSAGDHTPEPDEKFHEKLSTFRKISEGTKEEEIMQRKPKLSYSSLIAVRTFCFDFCSNPFNQIYSPHPQLVLHAPLTSIFTTFVMMP